MRKMSSSVRGWCFLGAAYLLGVACGGGLGLDFQGEIGVLAGAGLLAWAGWQGGRE